ncbi:MAG: FecR family protein [Candidatus Azobacteroides sp.]|nr:FecR family protein [Candidatus Azobacteroides sp.]
MKDRFASYHSIEEFITDDEFFRMAKTTFREEPGKREAFFSTFENKMAIMEDAFSLINSIQITQPEVSDTEIMKNLDALKQEASALKRRRIFFQITAACIFISFLLGGIGYYQYTGREPERNLLTQLTETEFSKNEIELKIGKESILLLPSSTILQQKDGSLKVGKEGTRIIPFTENEDILLSTPKGKRISLQLNDGSVIRLNGGSKLIYPSTFDKKKREVYAEGELFLEVTKNEERPFFVNTHSLQVKVTGTGFNVKSNKEDEYTEVVLVTGSVEVTTDKQVISILKPNDCLHYENGEIAIYEVDVNDYIWWKEGFLKVKRATLKEIAEKLSDYYQVEIEFRSPPTPTYYSGKFELGKTIEEALESLSLIEPFRYSKKGNKIIIY